MTVITNALVVTPEEVFTGTVTTSDDVIANVDTGTSNLPGAVDLDGDLLLPGLIELHTDNVEKHLEPRPGVTWPSPIGALVAHDVQVAGAGITTVLNAVSVGDYQKGDTRRRMLNKVVDGLRYGRANDVFRADHLLHLRCEVSDPGVLETFAPLKDEPILRLVSLMDHTPGQRQFTSLDKMRIHYGAMSDGEFATMVAQRQADQELYAERHRAAIVALWRERDLPLASHDDGTRAHIDDAVRDGVTIAEFPTTLEAAQLASNAGMVNVMGAPNLVRGGSHSGNVSALELADEGLLHGLSSDYMPVSLLHGALDLHSKHDFELPTALATVTNNVANALGLADRGVLQPGLRADMVRVRRLPDGCHNVVNVWRAGQRVC